MADANGVRRRDTTKGPPLRVLSLDGGGVRGYSMLIIVQELMHRTFVEIEGRAPRRHEIPKPCDHFDLIVGTGTGGLIALMLGRLRLDLETCKELYVRMTRMVFQTDKTIAGIPYRSTLFKASKLEDAIRSAVREHTVYDKEGNDSAGPQTVNPLNAASRSSASTPQRHTSNASTVSFSARSPAAQMAPTVWRNPRYGNPDARLYDSRENRTKTVVTAQYKGSPRGAPSAMLRSYDSRREPPPEFDCKIWQAGRATCAIGLAFKPIQIGQSIFHDDGAGTFNPAPEALDEAVVNEWPGREIGCFVSVGTGRRPKSSGHSQEQWYEGFLGEFADARRRLISKIENCEAIHEYVLREHLAKRNVNVDNYYRLNVEVGVGEFGMNEWHRLGEISTGTRRYMSRPEEQKMVQGISTKLAKIQKAKVRWERAMSLPAGSGGGRASPPSFSINSPLAVELPGDVPTGSLPLPPRSPHSHHSFESGSDDIHMAASNSSSNPRLSHELQHDSANPHSPPVSSHRPPPPPKDQRPVSAVSEADKFVVTALTPSQYWTAAGSDKIAIMSPDEHPKLRPTQAQSPPPPQRIEPPPLPPKTPIPDRHNQPKGRRRLQSSPPPYPLDDEAPPPVDMSLKPDYRR
ncbi:Patatin-like phospholipase [Geosmithia morbida]|uniref:Patatin-like phospholipase n=1 Tax=Geosmithia morbida TaxID=1094350 RepID=A0A9P4Z1J8_9HYPO|nr:Patatin-like phospholipase [Geosmithia morbida]KAF4125995.1 Patatin-like phospholipase [Geosmithia morbida]